MIHDHVSTRLTQDMKIPARMGLNERDAQLVQVSIILNESYAASGYYLHPASAVASTNIAAGSAVVLGGATSVTGNSSSSSSSAAAETARSSGDVDRWSDRFRLVESYSQRRLFDEGSLARRDFPPELGEMVDRTAKRRRHMIEMKQKLGRGTGASGASAAAGVKAEPATLEERMRALERNEERGLGDDVRAPREEICIWRSVLACLLGVSRVLPVT
jgi:hypothetical protein